MKDRLIIYGALLGIIALLYMLLALKRLYGAYRRVQSWSVGRS